MRFGVPLFTKVNVFYCDSHFYSSSYVGYMNFSPYYRKMRIFWLTTEISVMSSVWINRIINVTLVVLQSA